MGLFHRESLEDLARRRDAAQREADWVYDQMDLYDQTDGRRGFDYSMGFLAGNENRIAGEAQRKIDRRVAGFLGVKKLARRLGGIPEPKV